MVNLHSVRESNFQLWSLQESNAKLRSTNWGQVALFVGATSGIAFQTLTRFARLSYKPKAYIVGRNPERLSEIVAELKAINAQGIYIPIESKISLLKNVDAACQEFQRQERTLDLLIMCPGYLKLSRQRRSLIFPTASVIHKTKMRRSTAAKFKLANNEDGLEETISLRYYVRMRFVHNLLPQLLSSPSARILSIHGAGFEGKLKEDDLELNTHFSTLSAMTHTATMNTLALAEIASLHPTISCIHAWPGLVVTGAFDRLTDGWYALLRVLFMWLVVPLLSLFSPDHVSLQETGERQLFHATSSRYPPAGIKVAPNGGVKLPEELEVAKGWDSNVGSGCYLLSWNGETTGNAKLLDEYRKRDMGKKIWEHTQEVFKRAVA